MGVVCAGMRISRDDNKHSANTLGGLNGYSAG